MKRLLLITALAVAPGVARASGLIDTTDGEKNFRDAQKKAKKNVDGETTKHSVKVGSDDAKTRRSGKKKAAKAKPSN